MRNHGALLGLIVLTSLVTDGLSAFWDGTALAAAKCITKPNRQTPPTGHWYYQTDPVSHRKCWYLGTETASAESASSPKLKNESRVDKPWDAASKNDEASDQPGTRLSQKDRDALFREFVLWRTLQDAEPAR
jgi:hypothetical protein